MTDPGYMERMLRLAHQCDVREQLDWTLSFGGDEIIFMIECADLFLEKEYETVPVAPADVDAFEKALREVGLATEGDYTYGPALYACRLRQRRPCNMGFPTDKRLHRLFEAAGPDRTIDTDAGRHAVIEAHVPGADIRTFVFPAERFAITPVRPSIPGAVPPPLEPGEPLADTDLGESSEVIELLSDDGPEAVTVLTAGDGWPELILDLHVEPPPHPCAPHGVSGPDHCGLCGRTFTAKELENAASAAKAKSRAGVE